LIDVETDSKVCAKTSQLTGWQFLAKKNPANKQGF
jgi:hypothetical protein